RRETLMGCKPEHLLEVHEPLELSRWCFIRRERDVDRCSHRRGDFRPPDHRKPFGNTRPSRQNNWSRSHEASSSILLVFEEAAHNFSLCWLHHFEQFLATLSRECRN